ncbi:GntR family transcriptional regulator [Corynebacterium stationis]|uniref:GntR family transcriptional regulator n=1 Tax=Corynebacterium stationis TaxID=1705 RepID=UPI000B59D564|nr:GntR family transcriptional regulator [Corynebacterium stationis]ASJ18370.1 hypothetical protein BA700_04345 [Corynebacterium stationis]
MQKIPQSMTLTEQATEMLRNAILGGDLVPTKIYSATELGRRLGVSRTPIREALLELERRGLVHIEKNRGVRILSTSIDSLIEVFQLRLMLEPRLAQLATQNCTDDSRREVLRKYEAFRSAAEHDDATAVLKADRDFHTALLAQAGNARARRILHEQRDFVLNTGIGTVPLSRSPMECFLDHEEIMLAFESQDSAKVGSELGKHILRTAVMLVKQETGGQEEDTAALLEWLL